MPDKRIELGVGIARVQPDPDRTHRGRRKETHEELQAGRGQGGDPVTWPDAGRDHRPGPGVDLRHAFAVAQAPSRTSEERRVGKECVSTCRSRWSPSPSPTNNHYTPIRLNIQLHKNST